MNRTLQDRLVKELRLADICGMETGNAFLPGFMEHYNARFAIVPARSDDLHRPINLAPDRLAEILCKREQRKMFECPCPKARMDRSDPEPLSQQQPVSLPRQPGYDA